MLAYADLFWRTEKFPWIFWGLNQLTWRDEQFLVQCFGLPRSVCWSDGAFGIVHGHPLIHQYEYLVFLVVPSDKFFCVPLYSTTCSWGQDLPCSVFLCPQALLGNSMGGLQRVGSGQSFCKISCVAWWEMFLNTSKEIFEQNLHKYTWNGTSRLYRKELCESILRCGRAAIYLFTLI